MRKNVWGDDLLIRSHEVAHQWWGSTVGYETYHDQWLSEGLATYSSLRYSNTVVHNDRFLEKLREFRDNVFSVRKSWFVSGEEAGPIIQGFRTSSSKTTGDYRLIIYEKAALVLHMLRCHLTDWNTLDHSRFNDFLKDFYRRYAGKNASTQDFRNVLEEHTGVDRGWFFNQWIYGNELPEYTFHKEIKKDRKNGLWRSFCRIEQHKVRPDFVVIMPIEIEFEKNEKQYTAYVVRGEATEFVLTFDRKPKAIRLNPFEAVLAKVKQ
jgi:aminopeptidase N